MMFEGIAVFSKSASLVPTIQRSSKVNIHTYAILAGMLLVFGGNCLFVVIVYVFLWELIIELITYLNKNIFQP